MYMKLSFLLSIFFFVNVTLNSQNIISKLNIDDNERHANAYLELSSAVQRVQPSLNFDFTAVALKSKIITDFSSFALVINEDTLYFTNDTHNPENSDYHYSSLIHYEEEVNALNLIYPEGIEGVELVLINGADNSAKKGQSQQYSDEVINNCELPNMVPQSDWRSGLNAPNYSRTFTTTRNMIIHHSAGSNNATNYRQVVRDIYILHTQENGWSDIGYNYLVAPDGVLYAGRDPGEGEQDEVMGAHFCGSNGGTMGVCLMGNYDLQEASDATYETLKQLLSWKGFTDELSAQSQNAHPLNDNLGVIAGHRDGCSTQCPGNYVYARLAEIRSAVAESIAACNGEEEEEEDDPVVELPIDEDSLQRFAVYPNPVGVNYELNVVIDQEDRKTLKNLYVFDTYGRKIKWDRLQYQSNQITLFLPKSLKTGMYFLYVVQENSSFHRKFVVQ